MTDKALCIHGHFYQPPREDPCTGEIPPEPGAEPFANFNEKINAECYRPNAELGNFELLSFDLAPTLADWLEGHDPTTHRRIVEADRRNVETYGVGNAIAHPYYHIILPLASRRDKETQVAWGIADFRHRFGRRPEGMWLPEMAVDYETLEVLAAHGIAFAILSSHQARGVEGAGPYAVSLPKGLKITILIRDEGLSGCLAFDTQATEDAHRFVEQHLANFRDEFILLALDGETFGHHHRGRERFLHHLLYKEAHQAGYEVTFPARYLREHPPRAEVELVEGTSWSCPHGLARWREGCSCTQGPSDWKAHLRLAFDHLAEKVDVLYRDEVKGAVGDPWRLRDDYIRVMLGEVGGRAFLAEHARGELTEAQAERILTLLEAQRYRQAMYTSCAFFFEDLDRLEPRYNIANAAKAIQLVEEVTGVSLEESFRRDLRLAVSWITDRTGEDIYNEIMSVASKRGDDLR